MDIKAKAEELVKKLQSDPKLLSSFQSKPVATLESMLGVDLPDDQVNKLAELVKARLKLDKAGDALGSIGKLFG